MGKYKGKNFLFHKGINKYVDFLLNYTDVWESDFAASEIFYVLWNTMKSYHS